MRLLTLPTSTVEEVSLQLYHGDDPTFHHKFAGRRQFQPVKVLLDTVIDLYDQEKFDCETDTIQLFGCFFTQVEITGDYDRDQQIIATMTYDYFKIKE